MLSSSSIKTFMLFSMGAALCCAGQNACAHTDVQNQAIEGTSAVNALVIGHGCENPVTGRTLPVIAQSVVFPTQNPEVTRSDGTPSPGLEAEIGNPAGLAGLIQLVQSKDIFQKQQQIRDANGNVIGFNATRGSLRPELLGIVPFHFTPVNFSTASCARSLVVKVAVADICKRTFPPRVGTANLWIPAITSKFTNTAIDGIGAPAVLSINRNTAANPLPVSCGDGYDVTVTPSNADVDAHLPIRGYWGR